MTKLKSNNYHYFSLHTIYSVQCIEYLVVPQNMINTNWLTAVPRLLRAIATGLLIPPPFPSLPPQPPLANVLRASRTFVSPTSEGCSHWNCN